MNYTNVTFSNIRIRKSMIKEKYKIVYKYVDKFEKWTDKLSFD